MGVPGELIDDAHRFSPAAPAEEYVYGSCSPLWHAEGDHHVAVDQWITFVQSEGIERVCCLLAGSTDEVRESSLGKYVDSFGASNVCHVPTQDHSLVSREKLVERVLPFIAESVATGSPVVVHCLSGIGRTGQVLAAWLVAAHGFEPEHAVDTVQEMGRDPTILLEGEEHGEEDLYELIASMPSLSPQE